MTVHFVINVTNCSLSGLSIVVAGTAIGYCFSDDPELRDKCQPMRSVRMAFAVVDVVCGILHLVTCIVSCVFFCRHARMLHGKRQQRLQTLQSEVCVCVRACVRVCVCVCVCERERERLVGIGF